MFPVNQVAKESLLGKICSYVVTFNENGLFEEIIQLSK